MKATRREAVKILAAAVTAGALPAMPNAHGAISQELVIRLAEHLFCHIVFWGHTTWSRPQDLQVEVRLPRDISVAVGGKLAELSEELRKKCPKSTIVPSESELMLITYSSNGRQYVVSLSDNCYGDFLPGLRTPDKPIMVDFSTPTL